MPAAAGTLTNSVESAKLVTKYSLSRFRGNPQVGIAFILSFLLTTLLI